METTKHLSEIWNIAFPIAEDNKSSLMFVSGVLGFIPKDSAPKHDEGSTYHNQSDHTEINQFLSLEEKDRSIMELTVGDCSSFRSNYSNVNPDNVPDSYITSPLKFSDLSNQLPKKQNSDHLFCVRAAEYSTGMQSVLSLHSKKPGVNNNTLVSEEEALDILSIQLQDEYSCSTPKEKHSYSEPSSKYVVSPETLWSVRGVNSRDACREAPDGGERQANDGQVDPGQVQVILNQEQSSASFSESIQDHANALATRIMMQKTSSSSSNDFMEKLSLIDVEKYGLDSLMSIPSPGPPFTDQVGEKLDISPIIETIENCSSDLTENLYESRESSDHKNTHCSIENSENIDREKNISLTKKSRIPKLVQSSTNKCAQSCASSNTPKLNNFSNWSQNDMSLSKSISHSQSLSSDRLPSNMFSSPSTSVSLQSSAPLKHVNKRNGTQINHELGRRCLSALALDSGIHTNFSAKKEQMNEPGGQLNRSSSVSMCSLPSSQKRANYTHVQSKVRQYIHNIKASQSRRASPSRSDTNSPCKTPTSSGPGNNIYLLSEDLLSETNGALPDELQSLVRQLEGASGDPQLLRTLFRVLMSERQTRSEHEHTLAAMQLSYDNLLAAHARSQNLIDELRLQVTASHNGSRERVSSVNNSRASSPFCQQRRHSVTLGGHNISLRESGCLEELSLSQPNLIKETTRHITETNLGISLDDSGSMYLFPTPLENNSAIALFTADEPVKSGPNIINESKESCTLSRSNNNESTYSPENFNDQTDVLESSHISITRLATVPYKLNSVQATQLSETSSTHTSPVSASTYPLNASSSSVSGTPTRANGKTQFLELMNRTSLKQTPTSQISSSQQSNLLGHKPTNFIRNESSNTGSAIPTSSAMSTLGESDSWGTLRAKLKDFAALVSCGALTKQETDNVWAELVTIYTCLIPGVDGSETARMGAAMRLLASKFGLTAPLVGPKTAPVSMTKTQQLPDTCLLSTMRMTYERDSKLKQTVSERRLDQGVITTLGHGLTFPKWSDSNRKHDTGNVLDSGDGFSRFERDKVELFDQKIVEKYVGTTAFDSSSVLQSNMSAVTAIDANNEGSKETVQSVEGAVSAMPHYFSSISVHDVSDNERVSESVQVPELDSIYTVNEDTSSLSAEDYSKYISVLKRLHWKLCRQENGSKSKNKVTAEPNTDYLSKIQSLNKRIEQLCNERNGCSSGSSSKLKQSVPPEADGPKIKSSRIQRLEENSDMNDRVERHEGHRDSTRQKAAKTNLMTREAFASNDSLGPVSAQEKVELWRERMVASVTDSETDGASYSGTAAHNCIAQEQNSRQKGAIVIEQNNNSGILSAATKGDNDGEPFTATTDWRYSIGDTRPKDNGPLSKRFDLDSGCPISESSLRNLPSPLVNTKYDGRHFIRSFSEKSASDIDNVRRDKKRDDMSVCNIRPYASPYNGFKMSPFVEEHDHYSHSPFKTVVDGHKFQACESPLNNGRHQPMQEGIDQSVSDSVDRSQTSLVIGNSKTCDNTVHETLLKLQRDVDLMKSKFLARTGTSGKTPSCIRHRRSPNNVRSPGERVHRASRTPVKAVLAFSPSTSDSDAQSFVQEGHGGGVRRRPRPPGGVTTMRSRNATVVSHEVQLSPKVPSRSCKSSFNHSGYVDAHDSNHSRVSSSPRLTRRRKERSHSCPRMVPGRSSRSTFVDNQPTCCHREQEPESDSRPLCTHPSLPLLSDTRSRCRLNSQHDATPPLSPREYPRHQLSSLPLQSLQRSSSCRDLPSCSGLGCVSNWQDCPLINNNYGNAPAGSGGINSKGISPVSFNYNASTRRWKSDCDVNKTKSYEEHNVVDHTKSCTRDICRSCSCGKGYKSCYGFCDNCKQRCGSSDNLLSSLDTATALADSVHARSLCLLLSLRSHATPLVKTDYHEEGISASSVVHTDVIPAVAEVCTDKLASNCDSALGRTRKR